MRRRTKIPLFLALAVACLAGSAAEEKRLTIYTPQASYVVAVTDHDGREYVALLDVLGVLGGVNARIDGDKWKVHFASSAGAASDSVFTPGQARAKIRSKNLDLAAPFLLEAGRGYIPLNSLVPVLSRLVPHSLDFHASGRRLFLDSAAVQFSSEFQKSASRLVLHFSAPVNPNVATEPGRLRLSFTREPVSAATATQSFDDKSITSASFAEHNGAAELTVAAGAPLQAAFSDGGRTITIAPVAQAVAQAPTPPPPPAPPPAAPAPSEPPAAATAPPQPTPSGQQSSRSRFVVVIDPGHGGDDRGAILATDLIEKDLTLVWARRLRAALEKQGVAVILLRDSDLNMSLEQRANAANADRAGLFVSLHVASGGTGVRVYTAQLPNAPAARGTLLPWEVAQAAFLDASRSLASAVAAELTKRQVRVATAPVLLRPLNNVAAPAVAIEVLPPSADLEVLSSQVYQQLICSGIAEALAAAPARAGLTAPVSTPPGVSEVAR